jgi:hypothetical protein
MFTLRKSLADWIMYYNLGKSLETSLLISPLWRTILFFERISRNENTIYHSDRRFIRRMFND